jgi:hypothetical protein
MLAKTAGIEAGAWYAWPSTHARYELGAAGMLIMGGGHDAKPMDCDAVERWARVGYERGMRFRKARTVSLRVNWSPTYDKPDRHHPLEHTKSTLRVAPSGDQITLRGVFPSRLAHGRSVPGVVAPPLAHGQSVPALASPHLHARSSPA